MSELNYLIVAGVAMLAILVVFIFTRPRNVTTTPMPVGVETDSFGRVIAVE